MYYKDYYIYYLISLFSFSFSFLSLLPLPLSFFLSPSPPFFPSQVVSRNRRSRTIAVASPFGIKSALKVKLTPREKEEEVRGEREGKGEKGREKIRIVEGIEP